MLYRHTVGKPHQKGEDQIRKSLVSIVSMQRNIRYKPPSVAEMAKNTKLSEKEVKFLYRSFKQECPNGIIDQEGFTSIYGKIFPLGDPTKYAHFIFKSIYREHESKMTFGDFMDFLSLVSKGSVEEKMAWSFSFYDVNSDGFINKDEMQNVSEAIFDLMGSSAAHHRRVIQIDRIFSVMDANRDGLVSFMEFQQYCMGNKSVRDALIHFPG